jgi:polyisoprenyl-phosphate glycosyltransferase
MKLDIVVPCYNETDVLPETCRQLLALLDALQSAGSIAAGSRVLFVDDGSTDGTWALIGELAGRDPRVAGVKLSRNRGHQIALLAGLLAAQGDAVISIDADLQDDPAVIPAMLEHYRAGKQVVYAVRRRRTSDSFFKRTTAGLYYRLMGFLGVELVPQHADFRLLGRRALEALRGYGETNLFLRGLVPQLGFPSATVAFDRQVRHAGASKYPLRRMLSLGLDGVTSFSAAPLRAAAALGALAFLASLALTGWVLWIRFTTDDAVPGWASTVIPVYFLGGLQLLCMGVLGEYLMRVFLEVKHRPRYVIEQTVGLGD